MKRVSCAALLAIAVAVVAACSRPNMHSTGGAYGRGAFAPSVEPSVDQRAAVETATETTSEPSASDTTGR